MKNEEGQSLFEVVLALGVITAILVGVGSLSVNAIRNASFSKSKTLSGRFAQEATEWLRRQRDTDFSLFKTHALAANWCLTGLDWSKNRICGQSDSDKIPNTFLFRQAAFSIDSVSGKTVIRAIVKVYRNDAQGHHEVRSATSFSDWREK